MPTETGEAYGDGLTDAAVVGNGAVDVFWREPGGQWTVDRYTFTPRGTDVVLEGPVSAGRLGRAGTAFLYVRSGAPGEPTGWLYLLEGRGSPPPKDFDWGPVRATWDSPFIVADFDFDGMNDVMRGFYGNLIGLWRESADHLDRHGPDLPEVVITEIEDMGSADAGP